MTVFNKKKVNTLKQPMFFGEALNTQRYDEFKYPIFEILTSMVGRQFIIKTHTTVKQKMKFQKK